MLLEDIEKKLEEIEGVKSVHELHIWRLDQRKSVGSVHIVVIAKAWEEWRVLAARVGDVMHRAGVHNLTLQPEFVEGEGEGRCGMRCEGPCEGLRCCP